MRWRQLSIIQYNMPKYCYQCKECEHEFEIRHSMRDRLYDCPECEIAEALVRIPQLINKKIRHDSCNEKVGDKVKEYIEANRQVLRDQKEDALKDYEP
jgi:putative FmdB family regulatory protein